MLGDSFFYINYYELCKSTSTGHFHNFIPDVKKLNRHRLNTLNIGRGFGRSFHWEVTSTFEGVRIWFGFP